MASRLLRSKKPGGASSQSVAPTRDSREDVLMHLIETKKAIWKNPSSTPREIKVKAWNDVASNFGTSVKDAKKLYDNIKKKVTSRIETALKNGSGNSWENVTRFVSINLLPRTPWPLWSSISWFCHQMFEEVLQKMEPSCKADRDTYQIMEAIWRAGAPMTSNQYEVNQEQGQDQPISQASSNNLVIDETPGTSAAYVMDNSVILNGNQSQNESGIPAKKSKPASAEGPARNTAPKPKRTKNNMQQLHIETVPSSSDIMRTTMDLKREKDDEYYADEGVPQYQNSGPSVGANDHPDLPSAVPSPLFQNNPNPEIHQPQQGYPYQSCPPFVDAENVLRMNQNVKHFFQVMFEHHFRAFLADKPAWFAQRTLDNLKSYYQRNFAHPY